MSELAVLVERNGAHCRRYVGSACREEGSAWLQRTLAAFVPSGFPHSVSADYVRYQAFDTAQVISLEK